ncbi:MAG: ATP/GTP-binding protein [Lysobacterales bacterium]
MTSESVQPPSEIKIIITGTMGAGKTTAIAAVSDAPPVTTEADNRDRAAHSKAQTTVAMDYGEVQLAGGDRLRLYGTPGQGRFNFMWKILGKGALGVVILVDLSRSDPAADLRTYLADFSEIIREGTGVIGAGRPGTDAAEKIEGLHAVIGEMGLLLPVFEVDVRERSDVLLLLEALFSQIEMSADGSED